MCCRRQRFVVRRSPASAGPRSGSIERMSALASQTSGVVSAVVALDSAAEAQAAALAERLGLEFIAADAVQDDPGAAALEVAATGLAIRTPGGVRVTAATTKLVAATLPGRDLLARALLTGRPGGPPDVVDATAGLGADGFHLAALGHRVVMLEREPLFAALLEDALNRALSGELGATGAAAAGRVRLVAGDARDYLAALETSTAIVYLDPMFPGKSGRALPGKGMNVLRLEQQRDPAAARAEDVELLAAARAHASRRVVVKRPLKGEPLGDVAPSGSLRGSTVRYDLYAPLAANHDKDSGATAPDGSTTR